jgi:hypothetical protein
LTFANGVVMDFDSFGGGLTASSPVVGEKPTASVIWTFPTISVLDFDSFQEDSPLPSPVVGADNGFSIL